MGAIQNSINQMLGTVAGAVTLGTHIAGQAEANELTKADLAVKQSETEQEVMSLQDQATVYQKEIGLLNENKIPVEGSEGQLSTYNVFEQDLAPEIRKRSLALDVAMKKIAAKQLQIETYKKALGGKR